MNEGIWIGDEGNLGLILIEFQGATLPVLNCVGLWLLVQALNFGEIGGVSGFGGLDVFGHGEEGVVEHAEDVVVFLLLFFLSVVEDFEEDVLDVGLD